MAAALLSCLPTATPTLVPVPSSSGMGDSGCSAGDGSAVGTNNRGAVSSHGEPRPRVWALPSG